MESPLRRLFLWLMPSTTLSTKQKIAAVVRLEQGETVTDVAKDVGCSRRALGQWRNIIVEKRPDKFPNLAGAASDDVMADQAAVEIDALKDKIKTAADMVLEQLMELVPHEKRMDKVAVAFGILTDKLQVLQGKPTSIHGEVPVVDDGATPAQLEAQIAEIRMRREREESAPPDVGSGEAHTPRLKEKS